MSDIRVLDEKGEEVNNNIEVKDPENPISAPLTPILEIAAVADVLGIEKDDMGLYDDKLQVLLEYAKAKTSDHSQEGLKWALRSLEISLNSPSVGEKMIDYLHRYAYLYLEGQRNNEEMKKFTGGSN